MMCKGKKNVVFKVNNEVFFAEQFDALRNIYGLTSIFVESLSRCTAWDAMGGKSGSTFLKTLGEFKSFCLLVLTVEDDRFIVKELSRSETNSFVSFAPSYFQFVSGKILTGVFFEYLFFIKSQQTSLLNKIFGFYRISMKNVLTGKLAKMNVLVIENLLFNQDINKIFDLKGSNRNRIINSTGNGKEVLLDQNMAQCEYIIYKKIYIQLLLKNLSSLQKTQKKLSMMQFGMTQNFFQRWR